MRITIDDELGRRLSAAAAFEGTQVGRYLDDLIQRHCPVVVVSDPEPERETTEEEKRQ